MKRAGIILMAAALLLGMVVASSPDIGFAKPESVIDLTAPAGSADCSACHGVLGESKNPDLVFGHGSHLLTACAGCHVGVTHEAGKTMGPKMDTCFHCHGRVETPPRVSAFGDCDYCHPPNSERRPKSHVETWAEKPHAVAAKKDTNRCIMCHDPSRDCDKCHEEEKADVGPMPPEYRPVFVVVPDRPEVLVDTSKPTAMSQCVFCHPAVDAPQGWAGLLFKHEPHLKRDQDCVACHPAFSHTPLGTDKPTMLSCYRCHSLEHEIQGQVAADDCKLCHPADFELKPSDHADQFILKSHSDAAKQRMIECTMCHASKECADCHKGGALMINGKPSPQVLPDDHREPEWQATHGRLYLRQEGSCSVCHESVDCLRCHLSPMPHPTTWVSDHGKGAIVLRDCDVCHADSSDCQDCHHRGLDQALLVAENCVQCHPLMRNPEPTTIKNVPLAEHAVHFNVAESKGRPYVCPDCHIGFSATSVMEPAVSTGVHDLRVCYDCHGNLDLNNQLIADYPGKELCYRCHPDLRL